MSSDTVLSALMRKTSHGGAASLQPESRDRILEFVLGRRNSDGGFRGRSAESDLYYTHFGLECLHAFDHPFPAGTAGFLQGFGDGSHLDLVHLACLIRCRALLGLPSQEENRRWSRRLAAFRTSSGGFSRTAADKADSVYAAFLASLAYEDAGLRIENTEGWLSSILRLRTRDGAFADRPGTGSGTTSVTAAALAQMSRLDREAEPALITWLASRQRHGGFLATPEAPVPDLLSTATVLFAFRAVGSPLSVEPSEAIFDFIDACWLDDGGFSGNVLDDVSDCEYTYYGLLSLGCLAGEQPCIA